MIKLLDSGIKNLDLFSLNVWAVDVPICVVQSVENLQTQLGSCWNKRRKYFTILLFFSEQRVKVLHFSSNTGQQPCSNIFHIFGGYWHFRTRRGSPVGKRLPVPTPWLGKTQPFKNHLFHNFPKSINLKILFDLGWPNKA